MNIKTTKPVLSKWVVRYDDVWQMPQFVQGRLLGNSGPHKDGDSIIVRDIESIDLKEKVLKTYDGSEYILHGTGRRMILLDEHDVLEIEFRGVKESNEDL